MSSSDRRNINTHHEQLLVVGCGRSGTTWLASSLNYLDEFRVMFEPFHSGNVPLVADFHRHQYLRPDNDDEKYYEPVRRIMTGIETGPWIDKLRGTSLHRNRLLIKDIFCLLMLGYIRAWFPSTRIIYLLRHPCAVSESRLKLRMRSSLDCFIEQPELMEDYLDPFRDLLEYPTWTAHEQNVLLWCILNHLGLRQIAYEDSCIVFHEHLLADPQREMTRIWSYLGEPFYPPMVLSALKQPSATTRTDSPVAVEGSNFAYWQNELSQEQVDFATDMLQRFGLDALYSSGPAPRCVGEFLRPGEHAVG